MTFFEIGKKQRRELLITSTALFQNSIDVKFVVKLRDEWWVMRSWDSKVMAPGTQK